MVKQTKSPESLEAIEVLEPKESKPESLMEHLSEPEAVTNTPSLEEWADKVISSEQEVSDSPQGTINLSRFGLKNPQDVIRFLKSPAGEATLSEIGAEIARTEAIQEQQRFEQQQHTMLMHRLRALLFLWFIDKEAYAQERLNEITKEQNEKLLKAGEKSSTTKTASKSDLAEIRENYDRAINALTEKQKDNSLLTQKLTDQLEKLEQQEKSIERKYSEYESGLKAQEDSAANENFSKEDIETKLTALSKQIDGMTNEIGSLLDEGKDFEARELLNKQNALNLQIGVLHDMRAVHNSQKYYADAEGKMVRNFKEAHFILAKGENPQLSQRIIKDDNKLYLLKPGQDWNEVKNNPEAKDKARQDYKVLKQDLMSVKNIVGHHKKYEHGVQRTQVVETQERLTKVKEEALLIVNQITLVQSARASAENAAQQMHLNPRPIPSQTPTAGSGTSAKPSQASATVFYREQIKALRESTHITPKALMQLASQAPSGNAKLATEYLKKEFESYSRRGPIPQVLMQSFLKNLERFGVDSTKPGVTNIKSPIEVEKDTAPTPFNTKLDPFKP